MASTQDTVCLDWGQAPATAPEVRGHPGQIERGNVRET